MPYVPTGRPRGRPPHPDVLTPAEQRVLALVREGLTNAEIAIRLELSPTTVKYHVANMLSKLDLPDRHALAAWEAPERRRRPVALSALLLGWFVAPRRWVLPGSASPARVAVGGLLGVVALMAVAAIVATAVAFRRSADEDLPAPPAGATSTQPPAASAPPATPAPSPAAAVAWVRTLRGPQGEIAADAALTPDGSVLVVGVTGSPSFLGTTGDTGDVALVKLRPSGKREWVKRINAPGFESPSALAVDAAGEIYVAGHGLVPGASRHVLLMKLTGNGGVEWQAQFGEWTGEAFDIAVAPDGSVSLVGWVVRNPEDDPRAELLVTRVAASGRRVWTVYEGGVQSHSPMGIATDPSDGSTYVTACLERSNDGMSCTAALLKYDNSGRRVWTQDLGELPRARNGSFKGNAPVAVGSTGSITIAFPTGQRQPLPSDGSSEPNTDIEIRRYRSDGRLLWSRAFGWEGYDEPTGITVLEDGSVWVTGGAEHRSPAAAHPSVDLFLARISPDGTLESSSFVGGERDDWGLGLATSHDSRAVYAVGFTFNRYLDGRAHPPGIAWDPDMLIAKFR